MGRSTLTVALVYMLNLATMWGQSTAADILATVRIPTGVMAGGTPLPPGTYDVRLTQERPTPLAGQSRDAQRWVEFAVDGKVIAREIAEILQDDDLPVVGASSVRGRSGARVDTLKGGEFLRVSVKRAGERYLIHLPVMP